MWPRPLGLQAWAASDWEAGGSQRVCSRRGLCLGWEDQEGFQEEVLFKLGWREPRDEWGVSGPENSLSEPRGMRASVLLETTWFPGLVLESGQAGDTGSVGGRVGEVVGGRQLWPRLAWPPQETFLPPEPQQLLGTGWVQSGSGRRVSSLRRRRGPRWASASLELRAGLPRGCLRKLVLGPGPEQTWVMAGSAQDPADGLAGQPAHLTVRTQAATLPLPARAPSCSCWGRM